MKWIRAHRVFWCEALEDVSWTRFVVASIWSFLKWENVIWVLSSAERKKKRQYHRREAKKEVNEQNKGKQHGTKWFRKTDTTHRQRFINITNTATFKLNYNCIVNTQRSLARTHTSRHTKTHHRIYTVWKNRHEQMQKTIKVHKNHWIAPKCVHTKCT